MRGATAQALHTRPRLAGRAHPQLQWPDRPLSGARRRYDANIPG
jgi:hypothetical protein